MANLAFFFLVPETEYAANFSHRYVYRASLHYSMSIMAIATVFPQAVLRKRVALFHSGKLCVTNIATINGNDTLFCLELNKKHSGERFRSIRLTVFEIC